MTISTKNSVRRLRKLISGQLSVSAIAAVPDHLIVEPIRGYTDRSSGL